MPESRRLIARWIGRSPVPVWGTAPAERLRRSLARAGVWDAGPWNGAAPEECGSVLLLRGDHVFDDTLVQVLVDGPPVVVVRGDGRPVAAQAPRRRAEELAALLTVEGSPLPADLPARRGRDLVPPAELRRRRRPGPFVMPVSTELRAAVENRLFDNASPAFADAVDIVLWPRPARTLARLAVTLGLAPSQVTVFSLILAVLAAGLFQSGWLATGLVAAWLMALVDAVDGRLARLTLSFSQVRAGVGHALALAHPPLWWWAWAVGGGGSLAALLVMLVGSVLAPAGEGLFRWRMGFAPWEWRRFDALFRLVAANRTMLLIPLTVGVITGYPAAGFWAAAGWQMLTLLVQAIRLAQAWPTPPESWLCQEDWKPAERPPM